MPASIGVLAGADEGRVADRDLEVALGALERRPGRTLDILVAAAGQKEIEWVLSFERAVLVESEIGVLFHSVFQVEL